MQTVPRRPAGGSQRAKRSVTPSGVFSEPATKLSGIGFAGIEMSFMEKRFGRAAAFAYNSRRRPLNVPMNTRGITARNSAELIRNRRLGAFAVRNFPVAEQAIKRTC